MKRYKFDTKETIWHSSEYLVEDNVTPEELYFMIVNDDIEPDYQEGYLTDTAEQLTLEENDGCSTVEILTKTPKNGWQPIWGNGKEDYGTISEK